MHSQNPLESRDRPRPLSRDPEKGQADEAVGGRRGLAAQLRCRAPEVGGSGLGSGPPGHHPPGISAMPRRAGHRGRPQSYFARFPGKNAKWCRRGGVAALGPPPAGSV